MTVLAGTGFSTRTNFKHFWSALSLALVQVLFSSPLFAQPKENPGPLFGGEPTATVPAKNKSAPGKPAGALNLPGILGFSEGDEAEGGEVTFAASYKVDAEGSRQGVLSLQATIPEGWHIYSTTQPKGGPMASVIAAAKGAPYKLLGAFTADKNPHVEPPNTEKNPFSVPSEELEGTVTWSARIELAPEFDPAKDSLAVSYVGQRCQKSCIPVSEPKIVAKFAGYTVKATGKYQPKPSAAMVSWEGHFEPAVLAPGSRGKLVLTATPAKGWHVYQHALAETPKVDSKPTLFAISFPTGWRQYGPQPSVPAKASAQPTSLPYFDQPVTWTIEVVVPPDAQPGEIPLTGLLGFQTCTETACLGPTAVKFLLTASVAAEEKAGKQLLQFEEVELDTKQPAKDRQDRYAQTASLAAQLVETNRWFGVFSWQTLLLQVGLAFLGGIILNLMPCVLPVLGLKILSFVQQSGHSRTRAMALNLWYTLGLVSVFMLVATLAVFLNLAWAEHLQLVEFRVGMIVVTFAMGLSLLGVWEMTVPGLSNSEGVGALQKAEGARGSFFKGVFTTVLGISCSGPLLGAVFGYTLTQEWYVTYLIFLAIGLGMSSPFLAVMVVPQVRYIIPKPGDWMDLFKSLMGFALMGTVVFLLSAVGKDYLIATLALLVGVAMACWWIGKVPVYDPLSKQLSAWGIGVLLASAIGYFSFLYLTPQPELYRWENYSARTLAKHQQAGKTVMIDFTADWCANCQVNYRYVLNTPALKELVEKNGVVALKADWTNKEPGDDVSKKIEELGLKSIPILAIYPAGKPNDIIILPDLVSQSQVIKELQKAGPSKVNESKVGQTKNIPPNAVTRLPE